MVFSKKILVLLFLLFLFGSVFADGLVIDPNMRPYRQESQGAFINYENGMENLFIIANLREAVAYGNKVVWIFPVPANPDEIEITNLKGFPVLAGKEIKQQATQNFFLLEGYMATAVFPPFGLLGVLLMPIGGIGYSTEARGSLAEGVVVPGVTIYQHIDKFGIATEVVKGTDAAVFKDYLAARGTNLSPEAEKFLSEYMGKDYSFIVSWISDNSQIISEPDYSDRYGYASNPIGVFIRFPASQIYYPLKPTAYYGNDILPVTINIAGFKNPKIFSNIQEGTVVGHYYQKFLSRTIQEEDTMKIIFNGTIPDSMNYTRIYINKPANYFTQDLFVAPEESVPAHALNFFNQTWFFWMFLAFFGFAFASIFLANRVLQLNLNWIDMAIIAIANIFTVFAAALAIALIKKEKFALKAKEDAFDKKFVSLVVFEAIFLGFAVLLFALTVFAIALR
jgi:hypothetical protein